MAGSTKARGDIAEYRVVSELLAQGRDVLMPCGDRLPYDIGVDAGGKLVRLQVRRAWWNERGKCFYVDVRRSQTNRRVSKHSKHEASAYDFFVAWIPDSSVFYVLPAAVACSYGSNATLFEDAGRSRQCRSAPYRNAWHLLGAAILEAASTTQA